MKSLHPEGVEFVEEVRKKPKPKRLRSRKMKSKLKRSPKRKKPLKN